MKCVIFFLQVLTPWLQFPTAFTRFLTFTKCIMEYYSAIKKNFYSFFIFFILGLTQSIWVSPNEVDESRAYYTEWSKSERERQILYINTYVWNLEATVRTLYGTTDWFKTEQGAWQSCVLSPCLFNPYAEHIMRNANLDGLQAGIKIGRRNTQPPQICERYLSNDRKWRKLKSFFFLIHLFQLEANYFTIL